MSGTKSSRAREADKGDQDLFYSSDSELGSGAIKASVIKLSSVAHAPLVSRRQSRWSRSSDPTLR